MRASANQNAAGSLVSVGSGRVASAASKAVRRLECATLPSIRSLQLFVTHMYILPVQRATNNVCIWVI